MCRVGFDGPDFAKETYQRAAKVHPCAECGRAIAPGERYSKTFLVYDGHTSTYRCCLHCRVGQEWLEQQCDGFIFTQVFEDLQEHWTEGYKSLRMGRLLVGHKKQWRRGDGTLLPVPALPPVSSDGGIAIGDPRR